MWKQKQRLEGCLFKPNKAKDSWQPPWTKRAKEDFLIEAFREHCPTNRCLDFNTSGQKNFEKQISVVLSYPVFDTLFWQPLETNIHMDWKTQCCQMSIFLKIIHKFNEIPIKIAAGYFNRNSQNSKFYMEIKNY